MVNILSSICSNYSLAHALHIVKKFLDIIQIVGPILAIVTLYINLTKGTVNSNEDDSHIRKKIINSLLATAILFFMPAIFNFTMNLLANNGVSENINLVSCWAAAEKTYSKKVKTSKVKDASLGNMVSKALESRKAMQKIKAKSKSKNKDKSKKRVINGKKHKLSNSQLKYLAAICKREQGTVDGMRGEAHLIANRYELYGKKYSSVYDYVKNSGWFGSKSVTPTSNKKAINVTKSVIEEGNRTIPLYVDEHDCWFCNNSKYCGNGNAGDICTITGGSSKSYITKRKHYKQDKTKIKNVYGGQYTFYYFPSSTSDPFGYTKLAYNKVKAMNK